MKFACFICLLFVVSCGRQPQAVQKETFAENAEQHLPMVIDVFYPQALNSKPEITDAKTLYTDDSLHIASFVMKYQNALGVHATDTFQYVFGLHRDASNYYLLSPKRPIYSDLMELYNEIKSLPRHQHADSLQHAWMLHGIASAYCYANNGGKLKE
jgi:hypothetical protein